MPIAESVFQRHSIPVESARPGSGRVESGEFEVGGTWGGEPLDARVDCGRDEDGEPRAASAPVRLTVGFVARQRRVRRVDSSTGSVPGSRIRVDGEGRQIGNVCCSLTGEFRRRVLRDVAEMAGSPNPPPCQPMDPRCG